MILERIVVDGVVDFVTPDRTGRLGNLHSENLECWKFGCVVHNPDSTSTANIEGWPFRWRDDRGIMERICKHDVGHPDPDAAARFVRIGEPWQNIHGCDGCSP